MKAYCSHRNKTISRAFDYAAEQFSSRVCKIGRNKEKCILKPQGQNCGIRCKNTEQRPGENQKRQTYPCSQPDRNPDADIHTPAHPIHLSGPVILTGKCGHSRSECGHRQPEYSIQFANHRPCRRHICAKQIYSGLYNKI